MDIQDLDLGFGGGFDSLIAQEKAKNKCKLCHGRGYVMITYPKHNAASKNYCECVAKKLEKEE